VSFTDLDQGSEKIIFESFLISFESSFSFCGSRGSSKNWLKLKIEPLLAYLSCLFGETRCNIIIILNCGGHICVFLLKSYNQTRLKRASWDHQ
jgi:hypothetical protein